MPSIMLRTGSFCSYALLGLQAVLARAQTPPSSPFEDVVPSDELEWQPCYDDLVCAKLKVRLDKQHTFKVIIPRAFANMERHH